MCAAMDRSYSTANSSTPLRLNKAIDRKLNHYQAIVARRVDIYYAIIRKMTSLKAINISFRPDHT